MANGTTRLNAPTLLLWFFLLFYVYQAKAVRAGQCPDFPRQQNCPDSAIDQCKYDEDCKENNQQKCCRIGCRRICFDPSSLALVSGTSMCPPLPRPSSCPNQPNQCINKADCSTGQECCSDGCRMICVQPLLARLRTVPATKAVKTFQWKSCNTTVDLAFIIDSSGSIARRNYVKIKAFVKYLARSFGISPTGSRAGIVLYSTTASVKAHFGKYSTVEEFNNLVDSLPHERGFTYIDKALELAASQLFPRARKDVPKIAMLLTDGEQTDPDGTVNLRLASAPLRRQGVRLIAFGVGKNINVRELRLAVERDEDVVRVMKFDDLINKVRNYTKSLCEAAETEPIHPDADIIFLVDTSAGVSSEQFDLQKQFVRRMARYFLISPLGPRAAFATYGSSAYTVIGFSGYSSDAEFSLKINSARFIGGTRRIDQALDHAAKMFQKTGRVGLRMVILLTAGNYYTGAGASSVSFAMMPLRSLDAHLYVIGIGSQFTPLIFKQMVREPKDIFQVPSFNDLASRQSLIARQLRLTANTFKYEPAYFHSDVIFLMDSSRYVGANNYMLEKNFVKLMARLLNLANNRSRAALYSFSDRPQLEITFDGYEDRAAFDSAVNNAPHLLGSRRIDRAFESAAQLLRTKSRDFVPKYVILLTSGMQTRTADTRSLEVSSQQVRSYGGRVFVVAILTGGYSIRDFYPAVQRPHDAFPIPSYADLLSRAPAIASRIMGSWRALNVTSYAADIAFILDSSSSVTPFQYWRAKRFVRILSEYLNVSPGKSRGSLVTYGESPVVVFNFDGYNSHSEFRNKVTNAPYLGGEPSISSALRAAGTLFSEAGGLHPWVAIVVTPWRPKSIRDTRTLEAAARSLLNRGVWLYVLSIGENPYVGWLRPMTMEPSDAFSVVSYRDLPANIGPVARYITSDNYLFGHSTFQLDILFLMDTSSGVDLNDYKIEKGFVQRIALHLGVFNRKSRAALVAYGANASVVFGFGGYSSNSDFLTRINNAHSIGGERRVDSAFDTAAALLLDSRSVMPKVVFLLIAGRQSSLADSIPIKDAARPLRQLGAWVYIMAIGQTDANELQKATIRPTDIFFVRSFSGLYGYIAPVARYVANTSVITGISTLNADIVFVIDCSSDVPYREYGTQKAFVKSLTKYLNVQPGHSRVALVTYGSRAMPVVRFDDSRTIIRFFSDLTRAPYLGGGRRVDTALGIAMRIFGNARENVPKVVLLFMAGRQSRVTGALPLRDSVRQLHQQGVGTFIFRIGAQPEIRELHSAVDRPENVISFSSFAAMDARVPYVARHIPFYSAILGPLSLAVDVVYLLDSSDSVTSQHYSDQKTFVKQLSRYLNTMPARTRGAVITYGSTATVITKFGDTSTTDEFHSAIDNAPKVGGPRRMDRAIDSARNVFAKARPAVPKVVILLTTGNQPAGIQARVLNTSFQNLYDLGARLYAVTISSEFIILPLRGSAGSDWFPVRSFTSLPIYVVPLARHVSYDTAALGPYDFVADVIFLLDSSSRVTPQDYLNGKEFVKLIARYLNIAPGKSRGSVIVFSTDANPLLPFDGYSSMSDFNTVIDKAPQLSGKRRIDRAFGAAATLFQNARPSVRKIAILITGGRQSPDGGSLEDAAQLMRSRDVTTYVISIGDKSDVPVQRPEDLFYLASYSDLPLQVQSIAKNMTKPRAVTTPASTAPSPTTASDPCKTEGCNAPYNIGCRVVNNKAQCICPTCPNILKPVCTSDHVQDLSECHMKRQACELNIDVAVEKRGPCDKECRSVVDIAFIIDSSGSIGRTNWIRIQRFLKALVSKLDVSDSATHIAAVAYSGNPEVVMRFSNFQGVDQVNRLFDEMRWQRGYTYTDKALLLADSDLFQTSNGMRPDVPKLAFVITDGKQTTTGNYTRLSEASQGIKNKGVTVYVLGVGTGVDRVELDEIASRSDYVSITPSFQDLLSISSGIRQLFCAVPTQAPKVTTPPDPCVTDGCSAPYNIGCRVVNKSAQCICPTCPNVRRPVCASDDVQDRSECHLKQQACRMDIAVTVAKQAACDKECSTDVDIAFIVDSSGSIGRSNWERVKRFLKALVSKLDVSSSATHLAVISYSTNPKVELRFNGLQDTDEVNRKFDDMLWQRGFTYTDKALQLADSDLFLISNGMRSNVPKLALVITDGKQTTTSSYTRLSKASQGMKNKGVIIYAVGVGPGADRAELAEIASGSKYVYTSTSFNDLQNIAPTIRKRLCQTPTQAPQVSTPMKPDLCETRGCSAPYNIGCRVVDNQPQCICPTCPNLRRPVCASDDVQDLTECHLEQQACLGNIPVTVVKQGQCDKECRPVLDIAFIVDSSGSIGRINWERVKRFVKALISKLDVSSSRTRVAAIAYSTNPEVVTRFRSYQGTDHVNRVIDNMRFQRGFTYTDRALLLADRDLFQRSNGMRSNVPKLAFVITDGKQTTTQEYTKLSEASKGMKNKGVIVYAVGVGNGADTAELEEIASGSKYVYTSASFRDLQSIAPEIRKRLCGAVPTLTTTVTPAPTTPDPCVAPGCDAPYNIGCRVVDNKAQCICPTCPNTLRPVCASDGVQDLSECHLKRQACQGNITVAIAKQGPCDKECRTVMDIAFIIDSSGSIGRTNWERMKRFLKALVSKLDVSPSATHIAAVSYSNNPEVVLRFSGFQGTVQVNQLLDRMRFQRGFTYTDKALFLADRILFQTSTGMRLNVPKLAIVITDGKQTTTLPYTTLSVASRGIKNKGVTIYALGVGSGADRAELEQIASGSDYVFTSSSFSDLKNIAPKITKRFCAVPTQTTTTAPTPTTTDPCVTQGCRAPYNIGCQVVDNKAQCVCPTCSNIPRPVCATDGVQDLSECHMRRQACQGDLPVAVSKQGPCDKECGIVVDIALIVDSSGSIGRTNWERMKRFLKSLVSRLDVSSPAAHIAAIAYSNSPEVVMRFNGVQDTNQINQLLDGMRYQRGFTYTDKALLLADSDVFQSSTGMRSNVPKLAIVITDGKQTTRPPYTRLSVASQGIKNKGVTVYAIGVGSGADRAELEQIASGSSYVFTSLSFSDLQDVAPRITMRLCAVPTQPTTTAPTPITTESPCVTQGCRAPYNIGCQVVDNKAQCVCPTCSNIPRPVCATDGVQDLSECHMRRHACQGDIAVAVAKQGPCDKECRTVMDIAFVVDSSGSIGRTNWERMKRFLKALVSRLDVSPSATHIAAIAYSTRPEVVMRFNGVQGTNQVNQMLDGMRYQRGFTYIDKALLLADNDLFQSSNGMRSNVPKLAIVITDGKQTTTRPYTRLLVASLGIKNKGVTVYALGVGSGADQAELEEIASGSEYVISSSSFRDLQNIAPRITRRFCQEFISTTKATTTQAPTTTPVTPDPCETQGCRAPYNVGCRVVDNQAQCICPTCPNISRPVCASDDVQDQSECHLRRQACEGDMVVYTAKRSPCDKDCSPLVDIAFIIDSSGSIGRTNWERMKRFVKSVVSRLEVSQSATHVAAIAYSTKPVVVMRFTGAQDTNEVNRLFDGMLWQRGFTYTDKALQLADSDLFQTTNGMRANVAKIAVVITDGKQTKTGVYNSLVVASEGIKNKGVTVYAIGVGNGVDSNELEEIASNSEYVFTASSFRALRTIAPTIRTGICEDPKSKYSANVIFVMDSSSETASMYNTEKDLIKSLARYLNIDPQGTRAALIAFNGQPVVISDFESFRSASVFESVVDNVPHYGGNRSVSEALRTAAGMFPKSPSSVSKVVFLVTSGKPLQNEDWNSVGDVLNKLSALGVRTYVALIGPSPGIPDFRSSLENPENVFAIPSRGDIPEQINQIGSQVLTDSVRPYEFNLTMYVLFVIDSSAEVTPSNFEVEKEFIKSLISQLNIYPADSGSRVGIMVYSDGPKMVLDFQNQENKSSLDTIIDNLPYLRGGRRIDRALKAATDALRDIDADHPKFVVLVAAGRQANEPGSQTFSAAVKPLHRTGTKIHVMAVGDKVDPSYFQGDDKNKSNVISVPSFLDLAQGAERLSTDLLVDYVAPREPQTATPSLTTPEETNPSEISSTTQPMETTTVPVKVHGVWGPWGTWSKCTKTCGSGTQTQERKCNNPTPENGGRPCNGPRQQSRVCNTRSCPVHGGWGPWGGWSKCTKTCGSGSQTQERNCGSPTPENGGRPCNGPRRQSRVCNTGRCPGAPPSSVDIVFLLDTSDGVTQSDLRQQKDFAKRMAKQFGVAPSSSHAAVISYSDKPILIGGFHDYLMGQSFDDIVDSVALTGGRRNIQEALQQTQRMLTNARPDVPRVVFLVTYGQQARELGSQRLREMAKSVRDRSAVLYITGVGVDDNDPQLQPIVERRSDLFEIPTSGDLNSYVQPIAYYVMSRTDTSTPKDYKAEVIYVVDSSSFVGLDNYQIEKEIVKSMARVLNHNPNHTQSSVIIFDSFFETPIRMGRYRELGSFSEAVNNLRYLGGSISRLDFALTFATRGFSTIQPDIPKIIIVITNKDPPNRGPIDALASRIRQEGKAIYVIAVGNEADFPNLRRLVVRPEDMYTPKAFADVMSYVPSIASNILALTVPSTTAATTTTTLSTTVMTDDTTPTTPTTPTAVTTPKPTTTATTSSLSTKTTPPKPTTKQPGACPTKYTTPCPNDHLCEHDRQCPADEKCCKHSCGFLACTKKVQLNKPGSCPYLPRPSSCSSRPKECNYDIDCKGDLKCCNNGCGKICVSTEYTPPPDASKGRCPPYSPNQRCPSSVQDECTCDSNCDVDDGYKCCFDGCRRLCRKKAEPTCVQGVDVAFLMDSSESITNEDFEREKKAVKEIAQKFLEASQKSRAGVIMYSGRPELSIDFRSQSSLDNFQAEVEALSHRRSKTRIDLALRYASNSLFSDPRPSVISIAVVMTDGVQTPEPNVEPLGKAVAPLRSKGVRVLAVGVGPRVNRSELEELVTSQDDVFKMSSFQELLDKSDQLLEAVCPQPQGHIRTTPIETTTASTTRRETTIGQTSPTPTTQSFSTPSSVSTTPSQPDPKCDQLLDIVFVMDSSRSIDAPQYEQEKNFVKRLASIFNVGSGSRAAVIVYSDDTQLKIKFDQYNNLDNFLLAVDELPYLQKRTRIDKALTMASRVIRQARPSFPKVVIVMTDGRQTRDPDAVDLDVAADPIHRQGARVLVVGVGPEISQNELRLIAKDSSYVFTVQSFENLRKATRDVAASACIIDPGNPENSTTVIPIGQCPEISDSPGGSCFTYNHTCLSDEQCSFGFLCCFDGCRLKCLPSVGGAVESTTPFTTTAPTSSACAEAFDLGIAMDSSGSIRDGNYQRQRNFIKGLASKLTVGPRNVQLGLIVFSDVPIMSIRFGTLRSTDLFSFTAAVDGVPYFRGRTRIDSALETAANSLFPEGRQSLVPQVLLLITDGRQSNDPGSIDLVDAVRPLRDQSIKVIVVGIGDDVDKDELRSIVQNPLDDLFLVESFEDLARLLNNQKLNEAFCIPTRGLFQRNLS